MVETALAYQSPNPSASQYLPAPMADLPSKSPAPRLPSLDDSSPVSLPHYSEKDKIWVKQAIAASSGALLASKRRLRLHLRSLPPDSPEAIAIQSFLQFGR